MIRICLPSIASRKCGKLTFSSKVLEVGIQSSFNGMSINWLLNTFQILQQTCRIILVAVYMPIRKLKCKSVNVHPVAKYLKKIYTIKSLNSF